MEFWNHIIQTATLGTARQQLDKTLLPPMLETAAAVVEANASIDREEQFLQMAGLAFNYRQSGVLPVHADEAGISVAPAETALWCTAEAATALKDILQEDNNPLLLLWLQLCARKAQLVPPLLLPDILDKAVQHKSLRTAVADCLGKRGEWLCQFNPQWQFAAAESVEERWQNGTTEQRKLALTELRASEGVLALQWLQQTWPQENANVKAELLKALYVNISVADLEWLETLQNDKSQKVKEEVLRLLLVIPESAIVQLYQHVLRDAFTLKTEKALLGLSSKTVCTVKLPVITDDALWKSGIDKLSNNKMMSDDEFVLYQLVRAVPPVFWEGHWQLSAEKIINYFQKEESLKKYLPALVLAAVRFNDKQWAIQLMQHSSVFYMDLLPLLPIQQQEFYSNRFFTGHESTVIEVAAEREEEWGIELATNICRFAASHAYQYHRGFFARLIHLLPLQLTESLDSFAPDEQYSRSTWLNTAGYIKHMLQLKQQTIQSFK